MTNTSYISIKDAADLSGKSIQTIRRLIKSKKVKFKKDRTPQGFNYLIDEQSFCAFYNIQRADTARKIEPAQAEDAVVQQAQTTTITPAETKQESALVVKKDNTVVEFDIANEENYEAVVSEESLTISWLKLRFGGERLQKDLDIIKLKELANDLPPTPQRRNIGLDRKSSGK